MAQADVWPPFLAPGVCLATAIEGLERTQWLPRAELVAAQALQLERLLRHAREHVPYYARHEPPILTKRQLREHGAQLRARRIPPAELPVTTVKTSGSTGLAVEVLSTASTRHAWDALTLREHLWQQRDFRGRLGVMRYLAPERRKPGGTDVPGWGNPVAQLHRTGAGSVIHVGFPIAALVAWLARFDPHVLLTYPSVLAQLLEHPKPGSLAEVRCMAEPLDAALVERVRASWGVRCTQVYSANEVGVIAFQCREHGRLHVQEENLRVEVLDGDGAPCATGATGRVVVTDLHNLAQPLIRYELGDYATVGAPCACGRGLAVLDDVRGRVRNLARAPDGTRFWPVALGRVWAVDAVRQAQYVQVAPDRIELRVVVERALDAGGRERVAQKAREALGHPFAIDVIEVDAIARGPTGKFEEFLSLLD